jgi:hypothetical protein
MQQAVLAEPVLRINARSKTAALRLPSFLDRHVLPEEEVLFGEALGASAPQEIRVVNNPIAIKVKGIKYRPELVLCHLQSPVVKLQLQLLR